MSLPIASTPAASGATAAASSLGQSIAYYAGRTWTLICYGASAAVNAIFTAACATGRWLVQNCWQATAVVLVGVAIGVVATSIYNYYFGIQINDQGQRINNEGVAIDRNGNLIAPPAPPAAGAGAAEVAGAGAGDLEEPAPAIVPVEAAADNAGDGNATDPEEDI